MTPTTTGVVIVVVAMIVESFAQLFLKIGATSGRAIAAWADRPALRRLTALPGRAWVALGVAAYLGEIALYTAALHFLDVSVAFPLGSLCFVGVAILSRLFLGESVGRVRWFGIACILAGAVLVTR